MKTKLSHAKLIYVKYGKFEDEVLEIEVKAKFDEVFQNRYYENLNRGIKIEKVLMVMEHYATFYTADGFDLAYVIDDRNIKYKIESTRSLKGRQIMLDLVETT